MIRIRPSEERGPANHGWLRSRHSFSFGSYYDPRHMGVSALRVINDDQVAAGAGFATHSHQDMEIISYVKQGSIEHQDSMGNVEQLPAGEFQLMSAGTGVTHSEYNPSDISCASAPVRRRSTCSPRAERFICTWFRAASKWRASVSAKAMARPSPRSR